MYRFNMLLRCTAAAAAAATAPARARPSAVPDFYGKSFTVSPRAWQRITEKNTEEGFANDARFLRLAIDSGGCHGYVYKFSFELNAELNAEEDVAIAETDVVASSDADITSAEPSPRVVVDTISVTKLEGAVLDYHSELKGSAFVIVGNELVDQSCACAMSFSLRKKGFKASTAGGSGGAAATPRSGNPKGTPIQRRAK